MAKKNPSFWVEERDGKLWMMQAAAHEGQPGAIDCFADVAEMERAVRRDEELAAGERAALDAYKAECAADGSGYL